MADPKTTNRFVSTDSKFDFYANVISHAELYANNISANSFNVGSQTLEEYIQSVGGGGGSGDVTNNYITATFVSNNYLEDIKSTFGTGDVTNNYLTATFSSNNYLTATFSSNNYLTATFSSNNYVQDILDTKATNTYVNSTFSSNNYIQDKLDLKATNTYVNSTFTSNNYVDGRFASNTYVTARLGIRATNTYVQETFTSNNYIQDVLDTKATNTYVNSTFTSNNYVDGRFTSNSFVKDTFTSNSYVQTQLSTKLDSSSYTASDVLTKIKTVDGSGSGLDADLLDGLHVLSLASNNYLQGRLTAFGNGDVTNNYLVATFTSNNYIQTFVAAEVAGIVDSAPAALDTLNELAAALGDDANFSTTVSNQIGLRATNTYVNSTFSSNNYIIGNFASNNYVTGNFVSNNYLTAGQISNINVSQLQVGEEDSAAGGVLTVYGRQTGETVGGEIRLHTAADYDTNIPYYAIKTSGEDFIIELNGGTDVITIDYSTGAVDVPTGRVDLGLSDNTFGELRLYGNGTGSSQGGLIRMYTAADYDSSIDFFNMKVTADDWHLEKGNGDDILSYFGGSNELRFGSTLAYVSVGASDSSKGSLYLWSDGTGSVNGGELRIYNAPDHDTNVNYYSIYAESGDLLISYGSTDFLQYDETASQWLMPRSGGLDVTGNITTSGTVDGRDVAADGTKLDGIEAGATADQTASEILTAIKTVDGSGSGLDADLLDGIHATGLVSNNYFQDNSGGGGATGGGSDKIFHNNDQTVTTSYTIPTGQNSMTAGPISINSGVTVTVPSGSEWTIV